MCYHSEWSLKRLTPPHGTASELLPRMVGELKQVYQEKVVNDTEKHVNDCVNDYAVWCEDLPEDRSHPSIFRCEDHNKAVSAWFDHYVISRAIRFPGRGLELPGDRITIKVQRLKNTFPQEDPQIRHIIFFDYEFQGRSKHVLAVEEEWVKYLHTEAEEKAGRAVMEKGHENNQGTAQKDRI